MRPILRGMLTTGGQKPTGMTPFSERVYDALTEFVLSPWNVLKIVCRPHGLDPLALSPEELVVIIDAIADQVRLVTDDENAASAKRSLSAVIEPASRPRPFVLTRR